MEDFIAYDTETTGTDYCLEDEMFSFSLGYPQDERLEVHRLDGPARRQRHSQRSLGHIWAPEYKDVPKSMHNAKFDLAFTEKRLGKRLDEHEIHDTMVAMHILQNNLQSHALKNLCWELAEIPVDDETAIKRYIKKDELNYSHVPEHLMDPYQERDALRQTLLTLFAIPRIQENKAWSDIYDMEIELVRTTLRIEQRGIMVDDARAHQLILWLEEEADKARKDLIKIGGKSFEHPTDSKFRWLLYTKLKLPVLGRTDKTKQPSTGKDVLLQLRELHPHPVLEAIFRYRTYSTGISKIYTYLDCCDADGIIHPHINPNGAKKTSRESSSNPNLQNVSKKKVLLNPYTVPARRIFVPKPGYINLHLDYAGIEMRLIVHYSGDPTMTRLLKRGGDVHRPAAEIFYSGKKKNYLAALQADKEFAKTLRNAAKNGHFGLCYGAGAPQLGSTLSLPLAEARRVHALYCREHPKNAYLNKEVAGQLLDEGYVDTLFGRRLHMNKEKAYAGLNGVIQGTAAGIIKRAQNRVHEYLEDATSGEAGIIMPIHDELIIEYPRDRLTDLREILGEVEALMIDFPEINVPLEIDIERSTRDWTTVKEVKL